MSVLDDYIYQKENEYNKYAQYMPSYARENAKKEIEKLKQRSAAAKSPYVGKPTNQGFRQAEANAMKSAPMHN